MNIHIKAGSPPMGIVTHYGQQYSIPMVMGPSGWQPCQREYLELQEELQNIPPFRLEDIHPAHRHEYQKKWESRGFKFQSCD